MKVLTSSLASFVSGALLVALLFGARGCRSTQPVELPQRSADALHSAADDQTSRELVSAFALAPDGKTLAVARASGAIGIFDFPGGQTRAAVPALHPSRVRSLAFSPDSKTLACAGEDGAVRLREAATGAELWHTDVAFIPFDKRSRNLGISWVLAVAFAPDGKTIAAQATDATVRLLDAATGAERLQLHAELFCGFLPGGNEVLASDYASSTATLFDATTGNARTLDPHARPLESFGELVALSPRGDRIALAGETLAVLDVATGAATRLENPTRATAVAFSPDGSKLAVGSNAAVTVHDLATGKPVSHVEHLATPVYELAFSGDGKTLAATLAGLDWTTAEQTPACYWGCGPPRELFPDLFDAKVRVFDVATAKESFRLQFTRAPHGLRLAPDGKSFVWADGAAVLRWEVGQEMRPVAAPHEHWNIK